MFASASGELKTRSAPIEPLESRRHLEHAALALALGEHGFARGIGDVLAEGHDPRIALHLVAQAGVQQIDHRRRRRALGRGGRGGEGRARRIHVRRVDEVVGGFGLGQRGGERAVGRLVDLGVDLGVELVEIRLRENPLLEQERREPPQRVPLLVPFALGLRPVHRLVVGERVAVGPDHARVHERRTHPRSAVFGGITQGVVGLQEIRSVGLGHEEIREGPDELRDRAARRIDLDRDRDRVAVVFDEEEDRQLQVRRRGDGLPELALGRLPFAARNVDDLVAVEVALFGELRDAAHPPARLGRADRVQELGAGTGRLRDDVQPLVTPVGRHLAARRGRVVLRADRLEKHLVGGYAELEDQSTIPVVALEPVVAGPENHPRGRRHGLVPYAIDLKVDLVLSLELYFLVVELARQIDVPVGRDEGAAVEAVVAVRADFRRHRAAEYTKGVPERSVSVPAREEA